MKFGQGKALPTPYTSTNMAGGGGMVKQRRITKPQHIKALMQEQINLLRTDESLDAIQKAKAIGYLANTSLAAFKDSEAVELLEKISKQLEGK